MLTSISLPAYIGYCAGSFLGGYISGILLLLPFAAIWLIIKKNIIN